jgi:diguanylate cyclase (GGDEF)-like protein
MWFTALISSEGCVTVGVEKFLGTEVRLPTAPAIAARILDAVRDDGDSYRALAAVIATDPALAARLLSVANSSLYAQTSKVTRIEQAIALLGLNLVKNIALSFAVVRGLETNGQFGFDFSRFLKRAVTGAVAAEMIGKQIGHPNEDPFACALLQDVGMLVFALVVPEEYASVLEEEASSPEHLCVLETRRFGCDHQELGAETLRRWGLPESLAEPIRHHHILAPGPESRRVAIDLLYLADRVASLYHGFHSAERAMQIKDFLAEHYGQTEQASDELIDAVASRAQEMLAVYEIETGTIKPYSQLLQEANDELGRLNLSYEQLVMELKQAQARTEQLAAELGEANSRLRELVSRDGLTGLYNHRHFQEMLRKEIGEASRYGRPLALILFDVDFFKKVNDGYGHPAGDAVLKRIAKYVAATVRSSDLAARYGGEEFAIILPETDARDAVVLAERIRRGIETMEIDVGNHQPPLRVTVSLGLSGLKPGASEHAQGEMIEAADKALYAAKRGGRNRLVVAR